MQSGMGSSCIAPIALLLFASPFTAPSSSPIFPPALHGLCVLVCCFLCFSRFLRVLNFVLLKTDPQQTKHEFSFSLFLLFSNRFFLICLFFCFPLLCFFGGGLGLFVFKVSTVFCVAVFLVLNVVFVYVPFCVCLLLLCFCVSLCCLLCIVSTFYFSSFVCV